MSDKVKIIRVHLTQDYIVPMHDGYHTKINGWNIFEVIKDWFKNRSLDLSHAARDGHRIGNSKNIKRIVEIDIDDDGVETVKNIWDKKLTLRKI